MSAEFETPRPDSISERLAAAEADLALLKRELQTLKAETLATLRRDRSRVVAILDEPLNTGNGSYKP